MPFPISADKIETRHFINGEFSESSDKGTFKLTSPYSHEKIVDVCEATVDDTNRAVAAAKAAFPAWSALDPVTRGGYLKKYAELIKQAHEELAQLDAMAMGRPVSSYWDGYATAAWFDHYAEAGWDAKGSTSLNTPGSFSAGHNKYTKYLLIAPYTIRLYKYDVSATYRPCGTHHPMECACSHVRDESPRCTGCRMHRCVEE